MNNIKKSVIEKRLSGNDTGITGGHQAGTLIPKKLIDFFPELNPDEENPRCEIPFLDENGQYWTFNYIYYNNARHGRGTRDEYRLTGMTAYIRQKGLQPGDTLIFTHDDNGDYLIRVRYKKQESVTEEKDGTITITIGSSWKVIDF